MNWMQIQEASRFLSVGVANTIIGLLIIYTAKFFFNIGDVAANAIGYFFGLMISFTLNSRWTFSYRGSQLSALAKFLFVFVLAYGINLLTVVVAVKYFDLNGYIAQAMGIPPYTLTSYIASKHFVFRNKPMTAK